MKKSKWSLGAQLRAPTLTNFILLTTYCFGAGIVKKFKINYYGKKYFLFVMKKKAEFFCEICEKNPLMNQKM